MEENYKGDMKKGLTALIILFIGWATTTASRQMSDIIKKEITLEFFGLNQGVYLELSLIMDVSFWIFYIITALIGGTYSDKIGRKNIICSSLFLFAATAIMTSLTPMHNVIFLIASRMLSGAAVGPFFPISIAMLGEFFEPKKRGKTIGMYVGGATVGAIFGWLIAGISVDTLGSWRFTFLFLAIPIVIIGIISLKLLNESPYFDQNSKLYQVQLNNPEENSQEFHIKIFFKNKYLLLVLVFGALDLFSLWVYDDWIATYLRDIYLFEATPSAIFRAIGGIGGFIGIVIFGFISDKLGRKKTLTISISCSLTCMFLFLFLGPNIDPVFLYLISFFVGFFVISEFASVYALVLENTPYRKFATAIGFVVFFGNGFALIGGPFASFLADFTLIGPNAYLLVPMVAVLVRLPLSFIAKDPAFATIAGKEDINLR